MTQSPLLGVVQVDTANSDRTGAIGTFSAVVAAGANGSLVDYILFVAIVTTTAGTIRIFYSADAATNWRLVGEVTIAAVTPSGTVPAATAIWIPWGGVPFGIPASSGLKFCISNTETVNCLVHGGNL